jgi:SNF2 family DNA or RNA helicase
VTRFVMKSSIEEFIHNRQADKLETAADVLKDPRLVRALLATDDSESTDWERDVSLFGSDAYDEIEDVEML